MASFNSKELARPNFQNAVYQTAVMTHNIFNAAEIDPDNAELGERNAAVPHRMSWKDIRDNTLKFMNNEESDKDFLRWTNRPKEAAAETRDIIKKYKIECSNLYNTAKGDDVAMYEQLINWCDEILKRIDNCNKAFDSHRAFLISGVNTYYGNKNPHSTSRAALVELGKNFLFVFNSYYANVPDLGPHRGTNIQVSNRVHLHVNEDGSLSPMSDRVLDMTPGRTSGVATTPKQTNVVTTEGWTYPIANFSPNTQQRIEDQGTVPVKAKTPDWKKN